MQITNPASSENSTFNPRFAASHIYINFCIVIFFHFSGFNCQAKNTLLLHWGFFIIIILTNGRCTGGFILLSTACTVEIKQPGHKSTQIRDISLYIFFILSQLSIGFPSNKEVKHPRVSPGVSVSFVRWLQEKIHEEQHKHKINKIFFSARKSSSFFINLVVVFIS